MDQETLASSVVVDLNEKTPIRVLHVDDEASLLKIAKECLEMNGPFKVDDASSVDEAVQKMRTETYDVIVSDFQMPGKDGLEFLKELKEEGNATPFIIFTGKGREEVAVRALNLGAAQYLDKNGDPETVYCELTHAIMGVVERKKAEEALQKSEAELKAQFESSPDSIMILDRNYRFVWRNRVHFGSRTVEELIGQDAVLALPPEERERLKSKLDQCFATGAIQEFEHAVEGGRWARTRVVPLRSHGVINQAMVISVDITDHRKAEEALKETEERFRATFMNAPIGMATSGSDGLFIMANDVFCDILGYSEDELRRMTFKDITYPEDLGESVGKMEDLSAGRIRSFTLEKRYIKKNGDIISGKVTVSAVFDRHGRPRLFIAELEDVTERKRAQDELDAVEGKFRSLVEETAAPIATTDLKGRFTFVNNALAELLGYSVREMIGRPFKEFLHPKDTGKILRLFLGAILLRRKKPVMIEFRVFDKDGHVLNMMSKPTRITVNGKTVGFVAVMTDITELRSLKELSKRAERTLKASEEKFRGIFENIAEGLVYIDKSGKILEVNQKTVEIFGGSREELLGKQFTEIGIIPHEAIPIFQKNLEDIVSGNRTMFEVSIRNKKGQDVVLEAASSIMTTGDESTIVVIIRDVTELAHARIERGKMMQTLRANLARYQSFIELTGELGWTTNAEGEVEEDIPSFRKFTGQTYEEVKGSGWTRALHPDDLQRTVDAWKEANRKKNKYEIEYRLRRYDGVYRHFMARGVPLFEEDGSIREWIGTSIDITERKKREKEAAENKNKFEGLFAGNPEATVYLGPDFLIQDINPRFRELFGYSLEEVVGKRVNDVVVPKDKIEEAETLDGQAVRGYAYHNTVRRRKDGSLVPVSISAAPVTFEGRLLGYVGVYKDISDLKKTEHDLKMMNEKLHVVGGLTRHDVRNKLSAITGNAYLLKKRLAGNGEAFDKLGEIEKAVQQTTQILDFARAYEMLGAEELVYTDVEKAINEATSLFANQNNVKVINDCHGLTVLADSLLRQLFYNLVDNSLKYGQKTTRIRIYYEKPGQDLLKLIYEDDGVGIPAAEKPKLFREGYSTGGSTGYGLYLIRKIMEVYGWTIQETGTSGRGAQFTITIPKANKHGKENYLIA